MIKVMIDLLGLFLIFGFGSLIFGIVPVAIDEYLEKRNSHEKDI